MKKKREQTQANDDAQPNHDDLVQKLRNWATTAERRGHLSARGLVELRDLLDTK